MSTKSELQSQQNPLTTATTASSYTGDSRSSSSTGSNQHLDVEVMVPVAAVVAKPIIVESITDTNSTMDTAVSSFTAVTAVAALRQLDEEVTTIELPKRQVRMSMVKFADATIDIDETIQRSREEHDRKIENNDVFGTAAATTSSTLMIPSCSSKDAEDSSDTYISSSTTTASTTTVTSNTKFASKQLRGNLTRRQNNRNPYTYYEIINVLGIGSMGSVAMVRKRPSAIGGSARKRNIVTTTMTTPSATTITTGNLTEREKEILQQQQQKPCFQIPIVSEIVAWFHRSFRKSDVMIASSGSVGTDDQSNDQSYETETTPTRRIVPPSKSFDNRSHTSSGSGGTSGHHSYDMTFAMKSIHISRCTDPTFVEELQNEINVLKTLDHPHIEKVIETFDYESQIFVVLELCSGGDLYQRDPYTEDDAARITSSMLSAISYMHSKNILHRDLKYENILFVDDSPRAEIKLIDFGLSKQLYSKDLNECTDGVGTIYTMAPEVLKGKYTKQADLWSIGVITYMLLSSQMPFYGRTRSDIVEKIMDGTFEYKGRRWRRISKAGKAFIDDLLVVDPDDRATDDEALKASWLNRRFSATVRNPKMEEMNLAKDSVLRYAQYSKIRQMALMVIAHKATSAEIGILRKLFQQFDTDGVGHLNYEQFKAAIADASLQEEDYRRIFDAVDLDGSEKIRYTEFLAATIEASGTIDEVKLAEAFDRLDSDDSGFISVENLLEILGDTFTKEDVEAMIMEVTVANGQISYSEFLSLWESTENDNEEVDDDTIDDLSGGGLVPRNINDGLNGMIQTVQVNSSKNPFLDSERSCSAMSALSLEMDDTNTGSTNANTTTTTTTTPTQYTYNSADDNRRNDGGISNVSRANFLQGKMMSERNMLLFEQEKKRNSISVK